MTIVLVIGGGIGGLTLALSLHAAGVDVQSGSESWKAYMRRQSVCINWGDDTP
jgi:cation diffusion facilitator CzcD-associated flavoprotein CzcO